MMPRKLRVTSLPLAWVESMQGTVNVAPAIVMVGDIFPMSPWLQSVMKDVVQYNAWEQPTRVDVGLVDLPRTVRRKVGKSPFFSASIQVERVDANLFFVAAQFSLDAKILEEMADLLHRPDIEPVDTENWSPPPGEVWRNIREQELRRLVDYVLFEARALLAALSPGLCAEIPGGSAPAGLVFEVDPAHAPQLKETCGLWAALHCLNDHERYTQSSDAIRYPGAMLNVAVTQSDSFFVNHRHSSPHCACPSELPCWDVVGMIAAENVLKLRAAMNYVTFASGRYQDTVGTNAFIRSKYRKINSWQEEMTLIEARLKLVAICVKRWDGHSWGTFGRYEYGFGFTGLARAQDELDNCSYACEESLFYQMSEGKMVALLSAHRLEWAEIPGLIGSMSQTAVSERTHKIARVSLLIATAATFMSLVTSTRLMDLAGTWLGLRP